MGAGFEHLAPPLAYQARRSGKCLAVYWCADKSHHILISEVAVTHRHPHKLLNLIKLSFIIIIFVIVVVVVVVVSAMMRRLLLAYNKNNRLNHVLGIWCGWQWQQLRLLKSPSVPNLGDTSSASLKCTTSVAKERKLDSCRQQQGCVDVATLEATSASLPVGSLTSLLPSGVPSELAVEESSTRVEGTSFDVPVVPSCCRATLALSPEVRDVCTHPHMPTSSFPTPPSASSSIRQTVESHVECTVPQPSIRDVSAVEGRIIVRDHMRNPVSIQRLESFDALFGKVPGWLSNGLMRSGFTTPSLVQSVAIPLFMRKHDVVGVAPTGSGKTVAFALPILASLFTQPSPDGRGVVSDAHSKRCGTVTEASEMTSPEAASEHVEPRALVLCPTRELVMQTRCVFSQLSDNVVRVKGIYGGQEREQQLSYLHLGGCEILVATPGRLCDFVEMGAVSLSKVDFLVVDEADRMLELGFSPQLEFIMSNIKKYRRRRQTTMWTATWNATVGGLAARFMLPERLLLEVDREHKVNTNIKQNLYAVQDASQRLKGIVKLYDEGVITRQQQVLIFVNHKEDAEKLAEELARALRAPPGLLEFLHGGMRQRRRELITRRFTNDEVRVLCATDVAARGIDVPGLAHVINFDLPAHVDAYVHRIGRTGRAGRTGMAHTFITAGDPRAPNIARFVALQCGGDGKLPEDIDTIVRNVELRGATELSRARYKSHAEVAGRDWRIPAGRKLINAQGSCYVRGVGRVVTLKRPAPQKSD
ncbi:DEAD DEAH box helicase Helicase conserved C terminal domain [Trypanosoma vivax]|nr:DEAD DEAH box helicase Helicase conserved C terminal domain [Trypanosoma vivax]